jgi:hypothetical protein
MKIHRYQLLLFFLVVGQLEADSGDEFAQGRSIVLSSIHGVCLKRNALGENAEYTRAEDFIAGKIHVGVGKAYRSIGYGIGIRFNSELPFKADTRFKQMGYQVFKADDRKHGLAVVKILGLGNKQGLDVRFSYSIGDSLAAKYVDQIVPNLFNCKVVRT